MQIDNFYDKFAGKDKFNKRDRSIINVLVTAKGINLISVEERNKLFKKRDTLWEYLFKLKYLPVRDIDTEFLNDVQSIINEVIESKSTKQPLSTENISEEALRKRNEEFLTQNKDNKEIGSFYIKDSEGNIKKLQDK